MEECDAILDESKDMQIWKKYCDTAYMPTIMPAQDRIIAIGDIHGDLALALRILEKASVITITGNLVRWIGKNTHVVQVGDQLDGCKPQQYKCNDPNSVKENSHSSYNKKTPEDIAVLEFFTALDRKARKQGGRVISLLGNHEIMNSSGNVNYVAYDDLQKTKNLFPINDSRTPTEQRKHIFAPGNKYAAHMACNRLSSVIIGSFLFVHGGLTPSILQNMNIRNREDFYRINCYVRKWLLGLVNTKNVNNILSSIEYSFFWSRLLAKIPTDAALDEPDCNKYVKETLDILHLKGLIIGHTPQFEKRAGINSSCNESVWKIDTGSSYAFDKFDSGKQKYKNYRNAQALEIINDKDIKIIE